MAVTIARTANPNGQAGSANVATYTNAAIGTATADRIVVVLVTSELTAASINSCTLGGNAMSAATQGNQGIAYARAFYLKYTTGTTATIAVTYGANPTANQNHISVYEIQGALYSTNGADQSTDMDVTDPLTTGAINILTNGGFIAGACGATDTVAKTWANATVDLDVDAGSHRHTTASRVTALAATAVTCTGTTNGEDGALSWISFTSRPTIALTGTITDDKEAQIVAGGSTIILTVTDDTWVASGATFDAQRQNIINGIDSAQSEATGWDAVVKAGLAVTAVVRTSDTVVTITLPAFATYNITATETITATIPATALTLALETIATPTFQILTDYTPKNLSLLGVG
jgi:hypothetical protein